MMYLLDLPPSTTQFDLAFKVAFDPTGKTAKKRQNHLDFSRAPKEARFNRKVNLLSEARLQGAKLFATCCFSCCSCSICLTGGPRAHLCSEARWFTHQAPGQSRYTWIQSQQPSSQSSGMLLNFSCINMLGAASHGSWTAVGIPASLSKAQLI